MRRLNFADNVLEVFCLALCENFEGVKIRAAGTELIVKRLPEIGNPDAIHPTVDQCCLSQLFDKNERTFYFDIICNTTPTPAAAEQVRLIGQKAGNLDWVELIGAVGVLIRHHVYRNLFEFITFFLQ